MKTANTVTARIGLQGRVDVSHSVKTKVGSNIVTATAVNGRYNISNKRGNYTGFLTRRQILALADAIRAAERVELTASASAAS